MATIDDAHAGYLIGYAGNHQLHAMAGDDLLSGLGCAGQLLVSDGVDPSSYSHPDADLGDVDLGNQQFAFTNTAGQLRYEQSDGNTFVYADTNGDVIADFMLQLDGLHRLGSGDVYF